MKEPSIKRIDGPCEITQPWKKDPVKYKQPNESSPNKRSTPPASKIGPNVQKDR